MTVAQLNIPQMEPWFGDEETNAVTEYMRSGGYITEFRVTKEFESAIASYTGAKHCIMVNNGTISLTLALLACEIRAGDEVIVPNYTMVATPNSGVMFGAIPVFVDVEPETLCLDIELVRKAITPKTKAIMLVSANGRGPKVGIGAFKALAKEHGLALIEDSAQSLGSFYEPGLHVGTAGDVGSFSFSMPKIISTGQGGCLVTNDDEIAGRLRKLKDFGRTGGGNDVHGVIGFNFKFTDVQAAIGVEQMKKLPWRVERKKAIWQAYRDGLAANKQVKLFDHDLSLTSPWFIDSLCEDREGLMQTLKAAGVGSRIMYPPIHQQEAYKVAGSHPVSENIGKCGLWLPSASQLTDSQISDVCAVINSHYA